jgi:hypothetical protein
MRSQYVFLPNSFTASFFEFQVIAGDGLLKFPLDLFLANWVGWHVFTLYVGAGKP